ncbi:MAG: hypothetical protein DSY83_01610, partial [Flavobacteriia bacterium]
MKRALSLVGLVLLFSSCVEKKKPEPTEASEENTADTVQVEEKRTMEPIAMKIDGSYFKATGTEPFWGIKLFDD